MNGGLLGSYDDPRKQGLLAMAAHLLAQSGPSKMPTSVAQSFGGALSAGQGQALAAGGMQQRTRELDQREAVRGLEQQKFQSGLDAQGERQRMLMDFASTLPPQFRNQFLLNPEEFLKQKVVAPGGALAGPMGATYTNPNKPPAPSALTQLMQERDSLPMGDPRRATYEEAIKKASSHQPPIVQIGGPQTLGDKKVDETFAKEYSDFVTGGYADVQKNIGQLDEAIKNLESAKPGTITGPSIGMLPRPALSALNPKAMATMEAVEEVAQRNLRLVLGAQFTEKEGERLIARVYNSYLPEAENVKRVKRLQTQIKDAAEAKKSAAEYFQKNGTLKGWKGKLWTMADFNPDGGGSKTPAISPELQQQLDKYDPPTR